MLGVFSKCEPLQLDHREALQSLCLSGEHSSPFKFTSVLSPQVREGNQNATICPWLLLQGPDRVPRLTSWPESLVPSEGTPCPFGTHRRCLRDSPFLFVWRIFRAGLFCVCVCVCVNISLHSAWSLSMYFIKKTLAVCLDLSVFLRVNFLLELPQWYSGKKSSCQCRRRNRRGWGWCPGSRNGNLLQYSCLENPMDRGAWWATVHVVPKELDTTATERRTEAFSWDTRDSYGLAEHRPPADRGLLRGSTCRQPSVI